MPRKKKTTLKKPAAPEPTVVELQVLGVLWDHGPATARGVLERMPDGKPRSYTTILTTMQLMQKKGLLNRKLDGRAHIYTPTNSRRRTMSPLLRTLVGRAFGGRPATVVQQLLSDQPMTSEELQDIRALLDELDKKAAK